MTRWRAVIVLVLLTSLSGVGFLGASRPGQPSADAVLAEALQLVQGGRFSEALRPLRQLNTPDRRGRLSPLWQRRLPFLLGYASFHAGDYAKSTLHFERAREIYPELQDYTLWHLGEGLFRLGRFQSARMAYQWLLDVFPDSLYRSEALFQAAEANARLGELRRAAELYAQYRRDYGDGARLGEVYIRLGAVHRDMGNPEAALGEWRTLWIERAEDAAAAQVPELERTLPPTFSVPPVSPEDLYRRAQRLFQLNRHREALQAFDLARAARPDQPLSLETLYQIGVAQYHARQNGAAVETFRHILAAAPQGPLAPDALLLQARLHLRVEADEGFLAVAQRLTESFPSSKQADEVRYLRGHFYRNRGRVAEAVQAFQQISARGKSSEYADDAWWYVGWLQYGAGDYDRAAQTWARLLNAFPDSAWAAEALYWQGRALERADQPAEARARYERLRTSYRQTYYGYLAEGRLQGRSPWAWEAKGVNSASRPLNATPVTPEIPPDEAVDPHAARGRELWAMRLFADAGNEFEAVAGQGAAGLPWQWRAVQAFHWAGEHHRARRILQRQGRTAIAQAVGLPGADLQEIAYPLGALQRLEASSFDGLDPLFVGALIMAESDWNPRAFSRMGARGLMQLMPDTGRRLAGNLGEALASDDQLFEATLNLRLGLAYLNELRRRFDGSLPLVLASYNAGEDEVSKWWARRAGDDIEEFIANIPFRETRRYVQRVYVYYAKYQHIYRGGPG